jgi:hypothetical protein
MTQPIFLSKKISMCKVKVIEKIQPIFFGDDGSKMTLAIKCQICSEMNIVKVPKSRPGYDLIRTCHHFRGLDDHNNFLFKGVDS